MGKYQVEMQGMVNNDTINGFIKSKDFLSIFNRNQSFIPWFQRDRIETPTKINSLKDVFAAKKKIDPITINLRGDFRELKSCIKLDGELRIIDGQQRCMALKESGVEDYDLPVIVHYNLTEDQEIDLFHRLQKSTRLSFGEQAKSLKGPLADMFRTVLKSRNHPIPISLRGNHKYGMSASAYCSILHWVWEKHSLGSVFASVRRGKDLITLLVTDMSKREAEIVEFKTRKVLKEYVKIFGTYDSTATVYNRSFMLAFCHIMVAHFMDKDGKISYHGFSGKIKDIDRLLTNAGFREVMRGTSDANHAYLCNEIIKYLNKNKHKNRIPAFDRD